jgi:hypothetical protein
MCRCWISHESPCRQLQVSPEVLSAFPRYVCLVLCNAGGCRCSVAVLGVRQSVRVSDWCGVEITLELWQSLYLKLSSALMIWNILALSASAWKLHLSETSDCDLDHKPRPLQYQFRWTVS